LSVKGDVKFANFPYFENSVVQTSGDMIHYISAARNSVYRCTGLWINQYLTRSVFCCWWRVAYASDHL